MRNKFWMVSVLVLVVSPALAWAQNDSRRQIVLPLAEGGFVAFKSETAWTAATAPSTSAQVMLGEFTTQAFIDNNHVAHRLLLDANDKYIFGYDIVIETVPDSKKFKITVKGLNPQTERVLFATSTREQPARIATLPGSTEAQLLDDGDSFALDLLVNQKSGVKIVDVVKVAFDQSKLWEDNRRVAPRDFTPDAIALTVTDFRLLIDGNLVGKGKPGASFAGGVLWCYVEGEGRFIFSLVARDDYQFQKAGIIQDNRIEFFAQGKHYEWLSSAPIIPGGGTWNLWVLHEPGYLPIGAQQVSKPDKNKLDKLDDSIKAAQNKVVRINDSTPARYRKEKADGNYIQVNPKGFHVMVGAADRMENLLPK